MTIAAIPRASGELTAAWLTATLRDAGLEGASVASFSTREIGAGVGMLTELVRVSLRYDRPTSAPSSLVAKFAASDPQARLIAHMYRLYRNEAHFYGELAAETPVRTPRCYFVHCDPVMGHFVLVLEDLSEARPADQLAGCPLDRAAAAVRDMAAMHAFWWDHPRLARLPWLGRLCEPTHAGARRLTYQRNAPITLERLGASVPEWFRPHAAAFGRTASTLLQHLDGLPQTLLHGDFRADNLLFGEGSSPPSLAILDWQIVLRGPGIYDLGYFLSQSLGTEDRRAHEVELLALYRDELLGRGVRRCDRDELYRTYRVVSLFCLLYPLIGGATVSADNARALELVRCMAARAWATIEDHRAMDLLGS